MKPTTEKALGIGIRKSLPLSLLRLEEVGGRGDMKVGMQERRIPVKVAQPIPVEAESVRARVNHHGIHQDYHQS